MLQEVGERPLEVEGTLSRCRDTVLQKEPQQWGCSRGRTDSPDGPGMDEPKATGLETATQESAWHTGDKVGKLEQLFGPVSEDQEDRRKSRRLLTGAPGQIGEKPETEIHRPIPQRPAQCLAHGIYQILLGLNKPSQNNHHTGRVVLCSSQFSPWVPLRFHPTDHTTQVPLPSGCRRGSDKERH